MTARERHLALACGSIVALFAAAFGVNAYFLRPMRDADREIAELGDAHSRLESRATRVQVAYRRLHGVAKTTYGDDVSAVSALVGQRLTAFIADAGLDEHEFSRLPMGDRRIRGAREVGWSVQGAGPMAKLIDLLFLLESDPYLHRVENLTVTPRGGQQAMLTFRYLTLVFTPPLDVEREPIVAERTLASEERRTYDRIVARDIFRPYVKLPPPPPPPPPPAAVTAPPPKPAGPGPELFKVVSLSQWRGESEVFVKNTSSGEITTYHVGDALGGGTVVAIDYTLAPSRRNPNLKSMSRVVIADHSEEHGLRYWAIESGGTLAEKFELNKSDLPDSLVSRREKK